MQPFEGNCEADVAPSENEFDTPDLSINFPVLHLFARECPTFPVASEILKGRDLSFSFISPGTKQIQTIDGNNKGE